jgi:hypothetical protein
MTTILSYNYEKFLVFTFANKNKEAKTMELEFQENIRGMIN